MLLEKTNNVRAYKKIIFQIFLLIFSLGAYANKDGIEEFRLQQNYKHFKIEPVLTLDFRNTFIAQNSIKLGGIKAGVAINHVHKLGLGFYFLPPGPFVLSTIGDKQVPARLHFIYLTGFYEYVLLSKRRWEISLPLHLGIGRAYSEFKNSDNKIQNTRKFYPFIVEPSIAAHYKIWKYLGIGAGLGYRTAFHRDKLDPLDKRFSAPFYIIKIKIFLKDIYTDIRN